MCDFNRISAWIIGAEAAFLASLAIVIAAVLLGSNPFTSAANIPAMIVCAALAATAAGLMAGALASLDECANGPCGASVASFRAILLSLIASMATFAVAQAVLAVVAGIPFAGSAAALTLSLWAVGLSTLFAAISAGYLVPAIAAFNTCMSRQGQGNNAVSIVVQVLSVVVVVAALIVGTFAANAIGGVSCAGPGC